MSEIWFICPFATPTQYGWRSRPFVVAKELVQRGYQVKVLSFTGNHYLRAGGHENIKTHGWEKHEGVWFYWFKGIEQKKTNLLVRVINWLYFNQQVTNFIQAINESPTAVILSSPPITLARLIQPLKARFNTKIIFEFRDLWPLSLVELGGYSKNNPFVKWLQKLEQQAYQESDQIVGLIPGMNEYLSDNTDKAELNRKAHYIPQAYFDEDVPDLEGQTFEYELGFAGTLSKANDLQTLLSALEKLARRDVLPPVLIIGAGAEEAKVQQKAKHLQNVTFINQWLEREEVLLQLSNCRVTYNGLKDLSIYHYGIACVKWLDYWMLKKPLLISFSGSLYHIPLKQFGWQVPAEDPEALADQIQAIQTMSDQTLLEKGQRGFEFLKHHLHHQQIGDAYEQVLQD